jgi:F-type H+-transporting ATPase subunit epsilon
MNDIYLEIISPSKTVFQGQVSSITVPGSMGNFQILKNHAPLVSTLDIGELKTKIDDKFQYFAISGGTIEITNNKVLILADSVENVDEIDLDRAYKSKQRAEERLAKKNIDKEIDFLRAQISLARAMNRINLKEKHSK